MKKIWFALAFLCAVFSNMHYAGALSTSQGTEQNSVGASKFADPDEQMPNFVVSPGDAGSGNRPLSFGSSNVTTPAAGDNDNGARAFDQAFDHQQDK